MRFDAKEYDAMQFNMYNDVFFCQTANHQLTKQVKVLLHTVNKVSEKR